MGGGDSSGNEIGDPDQGIEAEVRQVEITVTGIASGRYRHLGEVAGAGDEHHLGSIEVHMAQP